MKPKQSVLNIALTAVLFTSSSAVLASKPVPEKTPTTTAALAGQSAQMDTLGNQRGQTHVANRIAADFTGLADGEENAINLINALRNGTRITLTSAAPAGGSGPTGGGTTGTETSFTPPTGKMGWGNVFISLALAKNALAQAGITDPTAADLQAALLGGDITVTEGKTVSLSGILTQRASGMGWGQIAQTYDTKLGPVVSSIKAANQRIATAPTTPTSTMATTASANASTKTRANTSFSASPSAKGIVSASGTTTTAKGHGHGNKGLTTATGTAAGTAGSRGVTTAAGTAAGTRSGITSADGVKANGQGHAYGRGMVTAAGSATTAGPSAMAASRGQSATVGITAATGASVSTGAGAVTTAVGSGAGKGQGNGNGNGHGRGKGS